MKTILMIAALFASTFGPSYAYAQSVGLPVEPPPQSSAAPQSSASGPMSLPECMQDLDVATMSREELTRLLDKCKKAAEDYRKRYPEPSVTPPRTPRPRPPAPPKPTTCETPDRKVLPARNGSCVEECADPEHLGTVDHVAVRGLTLTAQICVVRRVSFADLTGRVEALEGDTRRLRQDLDALSRLTGDQYTALFNQLNIVVTQLQNHEERIRALEAAIAAQDARDDGQDAEIAKARADAEEAVQNRSVQLVRPTFVLEGGHVGDAGGYFALGGRLEYENRFTADSLASFYVGVGATVAPVHQDNTFGTIYMPFVDSGVRIHTGESHKLGIDLGVSYQVRLDGHPAGYLGKHSMYDGSNFGPSVGVMWNFHRHMHFMARGTVGFGPENHLEGRRIALEYPVQPRLLLGFGGTIGL